MQIDDDTFLARFANRDLGPEYFDHLGHIRMAWLHLTQFSLEEAIMRVCDGIRDLAAKFNAPEKFNHTLSEALMRIMAARIHDRNRNSFEIFLKDNSDLVEDARGVLSRHYSDALLNSPRAHNTWVEPDIEPIQPNRDRME